MEFIVIFLFGVYIFLVITEFWQPFKEDIKNLFKYVFNILNK